MVRARNMMSWSSLSEDMVELILARLSLVDFVTRRVFMTCHSFYAAYRREVTAEQKDRSDLADSVMGRARVARLVSLIAPVFEGGSLGLGFVLASIHGHYIGADGVFRPPALTPSGRRTLAEAEPEDLRVVVAGPHILWRGNSHSIFVDAPKQAWGRLCMHNPHGGKGIKLHMYPTADEDFEVVALVQAMLSGGLARLVHDTGKYAEIRISAPTDRFTWAGVKAQIQPLLPFASRYIPGAQSSRVAPRFVEHIHIGLVPSDVQ
jgi:hypothetical protein